MIARKLILATLMSLCVLVGVFASSVASAQAALIHDYLSQITEVPANSGVPLTGPLSELKSMTVDSGHLWIAEHIGGTREYRVDEFDAATGGFISQLPQTPGIDGIGDGGIAVGHATGEALLYAGVAERVAGEPEGRVAVYSEAGVLQAAWDGLDTPEKSFGLRPISSVAVDNSASVADWAAGDVYVADTAQDVVDVFKPEADGAESFVTQLTGAEGAPFSFSEGTTRIAVDQINGDLLVLDKTRSGESAEVEVFEPTVLGEYALVRKITGPAGGSFGKVYNLAVDGVSGEIYVAEQRSGDEHGVVDQFSSTGDYLGVITGVGTPRGDIRGPLSIAVDPISRDVYVGDYRQGVASPQPSVVDVFGPDLVIPDVTTGQVSGLQVGSVTLTGTVNPDEAGKATCQFEWGTTPSFGETAACSTEIAEGGAPVEVQAEIVGLQPDTTYYYRLRASNANGVNPGEVAQNRQFTTPGPGMHGESVSAVTAESATLDGVINPHNLPTTYYFQYGTTSGYEVDVPASPGASLGSSEGDVEVSRHVQGLQANTVYHYRIVVLSESAPSHFEEFDGPDRTFTTQRSGGAPELPDGREWEMVTPPQKYGALFLTIDDEGEYDDGHIQASAEGNAIADLASQPTEAEPQGTSNHISVLSTRGPAGWSSQVLTPPHEEGTGPSVAEGSEYRAFSEDLSLAVVQPFGNFTPLSPEATQSTAYLRTDYLNGNVNEHCHSSCYQPLVTAANTPPGTAFGLSGSLKENGECDLLCGPQFASATPDLSHILLESSVPLTSPAGTGGSSWGALYVWTAGELQPNHAPIEEGGAVEDAVLIAFSHDGSRSVSSTPGHLFLSDTASGEVVRLDAPQGGPATGSAIPQYEAMSSDASRVFFSDPEQLTTASGGGLYECQMETVAGKLACELTLLPASGGTQVIGAGEDGSYLYVGGANTVYVDHYDQGGWTATKMPVTSLQGQMKVSSNGRWLTFMSSEDLTGYESRNAIDNQPDDEVYLYDASSSKLVCASCNPTGARPVGLESSSLPPSVTMYSDGQLGYKPRFVTDDGQVFFNSDEALVPQDVNGVEDVYEYEPVGVGDCDSSSATLGERSGGCIDLISSGTSAEVSTFLDASKTGGDVFFLTEAKLASQDFDSAPDAYDAHECTTQMPCFASQSVSPPRCSTGDSCKAAPSPQPSVFGSPPSATFSGAGNIVTQASVPVVRSKSLTRAQRLARALRTCKTRKHKRRIACERKARKQYGAVKSGKANAKRRGGA